MLNSPDGANWSYCLAGGGQMGARIREFDWSRTPLGPIADWPSSLFQAVGICLRSRFQLSLYWGPQLILLYNDAEREVKGAMHPRVLGMPAAETAGARALEEERRRAEALAAFDAAKTVFFTNVSREFRTPLSLVLGVQAAFEPTNLSGLTFYLAEAAHGLPEPLQVNAAAAGCLVGRGPSGAAFLRQGDNPNPGTRFRVLVADGNPDMRQLEMVRVRREADQRESDLRAQAWRAQEQAAAILESITDGFIAFDSQWRFTHVNAEAERIIGIQRADLIGKVHWDVFPATLNTTFEIELRRASAEQVAVQFENHYEPWDTWYHVKAYPSKEGGLSVFFHEITERKRSEEVLRKARDELEERVRERTRELSQANTRLVQQVAKRKQVEKVRTELMRRLVDAQEEEHRRIARELHDDLTQRLAVLAFDAGMLEQLPGCPAEVEERASGMRKQLEALSEGVHSLSRQLHPSILDELGIVDALHAECLSLGQRDGIAVRFLAHDVPTGLARETALCVYRVAQEALRNIARHAKTRHASLQLFATDRRLVLCVRDRGVGFDTAARGKMGLGLESMEERARLVRARLAVRSRRGQGTKVTLSVPLCRSRI